MGIFNSISIAETYVEDIFHLSVRPMGRWLTERSPTWMFFEFLMSLLEVKKGQIRRLEYKYLGKGGTLGKCEETNK